MSTPPGTVTVQFYVYKNVHWPMFEELYRYLKPRPEIKEIILCLPSIAQLGSGRSYEFVDTLLAEDVTITSHPAQKPADVTFIADALAGRVKGCGVIVNVGHGTISKGYYFTDSVWTERENWVDLLCVPGAYAADRFAGVLRTRVVATGMPKMDPIFSGRYTRESLCRAYGLDPAKRLVLYAPTFNEDLSSVYLFQERFHELAREDRVVLIKLHGSTRGGTVEHYRALARATPGVVFVEDPNIAPCLGGADVIVSDVSSVFMEFMALDKPVVLFNNPNMSRYHGFNPEDIEYRWRDLATQAGTFDDLSVALDRVLRDGDDKSAIRRGYAGQLFADRSGHAAARVWQASLEAVAAGPIHSAAVPTISMLALVTPENLFLVRRALWQAQFYAVMPIELLLMQQGTSPALESFVAGLEEFPRFASMRITRVPGPEAMGQAVRDVMASAAGEFLMIVRDDVLLQRGFDYLTYKTFRHEPDVDALTAVTNLPGDADYRRFTKTSIDGLTADRLAYEFINWYRGEEVADFRAAAAPPMVTVRKRALIDQAVALRAFLDSLASSGRLKTALSVYHTLIPRADLILLRDYLRATGPDGLRLAQDVLKSGYFGLFADVAERLVMDLVGVGAGASEIELIVAMFRQQQEDALDGLKRMRSVLKKKRALAPELEEQIRVLTRIRARCRAAVS